MSSPLQLLLRILYYCQYGLRPCYSERPLRNHALPLLYETGQFCQGGLTDSHCIIDILVPKYNPTAVLLTFSQSCSIDRSTLEQLAESL